MTAAPCWAATPLHSLRKDSRSLGEVLRHCCRDGHDHLFFIKATAKQLHKS